MKLNKFVAISLGCVLSVSFLHAEEEVELCAAQPTTHGCSALSPEMQRFAGELTPINRQMFCEKFTDGQRASAMQMALEPTTEGVVTTPDMAVQKVAEANDTKLDQTPSIRCPMK